MGSARGRLLKMSCLLLLVAATPWAFFQLVVLAAGVGFAPRHFPEQRLPRGQA